MDMEQKEIEEENNQNSAAISLIDDQNITKTSIDISKIINDVKNHINDKIAIVINKEELLQKDFIVTEESIDRLRLITYYISRGANCLLVGPPLYFRKNKIYRYSLSSKSQKVISI